MFTYCPVNRLYSVKFSKHEKKIEFENAKNHRISQSRHPKQSDDSLEIPAKGSDHMNGHVVSDDPPLEVLGPGYTIVDPPEQIGSRWPKTSSTPPAVDNPDPDKFKTSVQFYPVRNTPARAVCGTYKHPPDYKTSCSRTRSTQTEPPERCEEPNKTPQSVLCGSINRNGFCRDGLRTPSDAVSWCSALREDHSSHPPSLCSLGELESEVSAIGAPHSQAWPADIPCNPDLDEIPLSVILIGDSGTGKTCIVARLADDMFMEIYDVTVGIDFSIVRFKLDDGRPVRLQVWDTAGQEKFRAITSTYYRRAMGVVFVYDVAKRTSLDNVIKVWNKEVDKFAEAGTVRMLVGNKMDLDDHRTITTRVGAKVAKDLGALFYEVSAKEDIHVKMAFRAFAKDILDNVYPKRNPCVSANAVHVGHRSNHDRIDKKVCSC